MPNAVKHNIYVDFFFTADIFKTHVLEICGMCCALYKQTFRAYGCSTGQQRSAQGIGIIISEKHFTFKDKSINIHTVLNVLHTAVCKLKQ